MGKSINILDKAYLQWVKELTTRYRQSQIKAAVKVNSFLIEFYWGLGSDIVSLEVDNKYGGKFYATLSADLRKDMQSGFISSTPNVPEIFNKLLKNYAAFRGVIIYVS